MILFHYPYTLIVSEIEQMITVNWIMVLREWNIEN